MPEWCPKCNAMLPPGLEKCPQCGARLSAGKKHKSGSAGHSGNNINISNRDIFWYSVYIIGIGMIPVIVAVLLGLLCAHFGR